MKTLEGKLSWQCLEWKGKIFPFLKLFQVLLLLLINSCQTRPKPASEVYEANDLHLRLAAMPKGLQRFKIDGPFEVESLSDLYLPLAADHGINVDVYRSRALGPVPMVVISHGNFSGKRSHQAQAERLASWGMHVVVLELPNRDQWLENGVRIAEVTNFLYRWPQYIHENADPKRILLVGHSFGGSAVTLAASQGAPAAGIILLDPAVVHPSVADAMKRVSVPGILLGADPKVFQSRKRSLFRQRWQGEFFEISVVQATHDDAQGPSMFSRFTFGVDPFTDDSQRDIFKSALVSASISLLQFGNVELFRSDVSLEVAKKKINRVAFKASSSY
jgi:dienelactone hydrolase